MNWKDRCPNPLCVKPSDFHFDDFTPPAVALMRCQHCKTVFKLMVNKDLSVHFGVFDPASEPPDGSCEIR